jgi:hypothetical protein
MREILTTQLNVLVLIIFVFLAGLFPRTTERSSESYKSKFGAIPVTKCVISVDRKVANPRVEYFYVGTDCDQMQKLAEEGKPLPTIKP